MNHRFAAVLLATACGAAGCATGEADSAPPSLGDTCSEAARLTTWSNWGEGFFAGYCRTCHSASTADRRGAPPAVNFDSEAEVAAQLSAIERTVLDEGTMPVGGGVPEAELQRLRAFLACGR